MQIRVTTQGPYVVTDGPGPHRARPLSTERAEPIAWEHDSTLPSDAGYSLCRCGASAHKPFCDGSHVTHEWDGTETAPTTDYGERARSLAGTGITVRDDRGLCEHAGFCANKLSNVWKMTAETENTAVRSQVAAMVERCPSGALTYRLPGSGDDVEPPLAPAVAVLDNGPLWVTGSVPVERADGQHLETRARMTLCRCGASNNKPLCDGSHAALGFADAAAPVPAQPGSA